MAGVAVAFALASCGGGADTAAVTEDALGRDARAVQPSPGLDESLANELKRHGFTGKIESTLESRLGRKVDAKLADLGNKLFFDTIAGLHDDNTCAGCHSPAAGMGDTQSIAIGVDSNRIVGAAQVSGNAADRYKFRTTPLRNVALQPAFFHNGAFTRLEDAIRHHLDVAKSARNYDPRRAGVAADLRHRLGPIEPVLKTLDPLLSQPIDLSAREFEDLVAFVRDGLLDPRARPSQMCRVIPNAVPSGRALLHFQGCGRSHRD